MKFSSLLILLSLSLFAKVNAQVPPESTDKIMNAAYQQASKENKNVFVIFHASWCGWCRKMDSSINDPSVKSFFYNNYVLTHLIVYESKGKEALENPGALELLTKYGGNDQGLPYWFIFDVKKNLLADSRMQYAGKNELNNTGCPANEEEVNNFIKVLKKTSRLNEKELAAIAKRFRQNEQ